MFGFGLPELLVLSILAVVVSCFWKIFSKAGFSGWLSFTLIVPILNIVMLFYLAFAEWPVHRQLNRRHPSQPGDQATPTDPGNPSNHEAPVAPRSKPDDDPPRGEITGGSMGKNVLAHLIGILIGLVVWLAVGMVGLFLAIAVQRPGYRTIGAWIGIFAGSVVWAILSEKLKNKWGIVKK